MKRRLPLAGYLLAALLASSVPSARAGVDPSAEWFNEAIRHDAEGDAGLAYALYHRAAETGMPEAEFNVAAMLDSGRGVRADIAEAATWYARAAAHGDARAAYNLGQLYEAGEGVPRNPYLARAWFTASSLGAAREHLAAAPPHTTQAVQLLKAPTLVAPPPGKRVDARLDDIEFIWTAQDSSEPVRFFLELRSLDAGGSREVFSSFAETSSLSAKMPAASGAYAWRVMAVAPETGTYAASAWTQFSIGPTDPPVARMSLAPP